MSTDSSYKKDIEDFWGTQWLEAHQGLNVSSHLTLFKFKYFLKPLLNALDPKAKVCEIGSGNCQWLSLVRSYRPDLHLYGIDISDASIGFAKKFGVEPIQADIRKIPLQDNYFDLTFSWGVIEHMPNSEKALQEQYRVSRRFLVVDVPYKTSLPAITIQRAIKKRKLSEYQAMIEFGKLFSRSDFQKLIYSTINPKDRVIFRNNFQVFPKTSLFKIPIGSFFDRFTPYWVRSKIGHNIGAIIHKNDL